MLNIKKCCNCKSTNIKYTSTEIYCENCGLVLASVPPNYIGIEKIYYPYGLLFG